jgi:hypothetical protein
MAPAHHMHRAVLARYKISFAKSYLFGNGQKKEGRKLLSISNNHKLAFLYKDFMTRS